MSFEDGKAMVVYHKKTGKIVSYDLSPMGEVILPKEFQAKEDEYLVGCFANNKIDWENNYVLLN
jgi:hypothetical protein